MGFFHWLGDEQTKAFDALQLDIVGFLAILGEGSVLANAQVATLSRWIFLPRLIPAPQALMRPSRPTQLDSALGKVTGIYSGNVIDSINHIGNIICDADNLPPHSVRVVKIKHVKDAASRPLKAKTVAPLMIPLFLGFFLSCILLGLSIWRSDGMSLVATITLSFLTSLIGYGNKWELQLPVRAQKDGNVPRGDVVIRYPKGVFLVVRCDEDVARELYFAPETMKYMLTHGPAYRVLSLVGTLMLMVGVICLGNSTTELQVGWAASFMLLGTSYWIVAALPEKLHWDTSAFAIENECLSDSDMTQKGYPCENKTFTQALWRAIVLAKNIDWVRKSNACPDTPAWGKWLAKAKEEAMKVRLTDQQRIGLNGEAVTTWQVPTEWDPQKALGALLKQQAQQDEKELKDGLEEV